MFFCVRFLCAEIPAEELVRHMLSFFHFVVNHCLNNGVKVWRRFRFMVSHRSLEATVHDTQIFRGARTDVSGMVTSTSWLLRAGSTSLSLDVEVSNSGSSYVSCMAPGACEPAISYL